MVRYFLFLLVVVLLLTIAVILRYRRIIKRMAQLVEFLDVVDTPKEGVAQSYKRLYLREVIEKGQASLLSGKKPWTIERLDKASDAVVDKEFARLNKTVPPRAKDLVSSLAGVDDIQAVMADINRNFLIKNPLAIGCPTITRSPTDILGSHIYEKCGAYLAPVAVICTLFNHLDWETFARISDERRREQSVQISPDKPIPEGSSE